MNPMTIHSAFSELPEGVAIECRRARITALIALATSILIPLPSAPVEDSQRRSWFYENMQALKDIYYKINEAIPYDVDRAVEYAFRLFDKRYCLSVGLTANDLLGSMSWGQVCREIIPELDQLKINAENVFCTQQLLKQCMNVE